MPQILPLVPSVAAYRVGTQLDGDQFILDVRWNSRADAWFLDILSEAEEPIRMGIKIVLGTLLGRRCVDPRFPNGLLIASDLSNAGREATFDDMGVRVVVFFYPATEVAAL